MPRKTRASNKKKLDPKYSVLSHPEERVLNKDPIVFEDEESASRRLLSTLKGLGRIISNITSLWGDKQMPNHVVSDLIKYETKYSEIKKTNRLT